LRAALTDAGILNPEDDGARLLRLQQLLGASSAGTGLSPGELEDAVVPAASETPEPDGTLDSSAHPPRRYGPRTARQRARLEALRARLTEAGVLPIAQPGGRSAGVANSAGGPSGTGDAPPPPTDPAPDSRVLPITRPGPPDGALDADLRATRIVSDPDDQGPAAPADGRGPGARASRVSPPVNRSTGATQPSPDTPAVPGPVAPAARDNSGVVPLPPGRPPADPAPMSAGTGTQSNPPPPMRTGPGSAAPDGGRSAAPEPASASSASSDAGRAGDGPAQAGSTLPGTTAGAATPARGKGSRNPGYWAWRAKQAPGQPLNKPRGKRKS
jgi:hypothetical protein